MPVKYPRRAGLNLVTGQTIIYHLGDDGDYELGLPKRYEVLSTGQHSGTTNVDVAHYAAATLAFVAATKKITDSANGLVTFLTADTIVVKGSALNDGTYTIATGGVAGEIVVTEALVDEAAGAYVSLYKRAAQSNNAVQDLNTGKMWHRYVSTGKLGVASDGKLNWYATATCFTLHPAAADVAMVAGNILRIVGSDESTRYHAGDVLDCTGFANAVNNLPGLVVLSCSFTGGNTDIVVDPLGSTLVAEAAAGSRSILLVCRSIFSYMAAARIVGLAGYSDWRAPNIFELFLLGRAPGAAPNTTAFPTFPGSSSAIWTSSSVGLSEKVRVQFLGGGQVASNSDPTATYPVVLVRGGI